MRIHSLNRIRWFALPGVPEEKPAESDPEDFEDIAPPRLRVPRTLVLVIAAVLAAAMLAAGLWGLTHSTITYGAGPVDAATRAHIVQVGEQLQAAGAPQPALDLIARAARPGINSGDALEALAQTDEILASSGAGMAAPRQELRAVLETLRANLYGGHGSQTPGPVLTPPPALPLPAP